MLLRLLVTALLESVRLGPALLRRPVPVVWYDHVRDLRARRNLGRIARQLSAGAGLPVHVYAGTGTAMTLEGPETCTAAAHAGWTTAVLTHTR